MEIEKTLRLAAPPAAVWALLLDPTAMGACVPGIQSIEVLSDDEYIAVMQVKISFISARFKLKTRIVERDEPNYLRSEGTGEDAKVASSLKQTSEMWLQPTADGGTDLRMTVKVDVFGRMGAFGLSVMKTKADRMWDEFGVNAAARLAAADTAIAASAILADADLPEQCSTTATAATAAPAAPASSMEAARSGHTGHVAPSLEAPAATAAVAKPVPATIRPTPSEAKPGFWLRLFGGAAPTQAPSTDIRVEVRRGDTVITVHWPVQAAQECSAWLRTLNANEPIT